MSERLRVPAILVALSLLALAGCSTGKEAAGEPTGHPAASAAATPSSTALASSPAPAPAPEPSPSPAPEPSPSPAPEPSPSPAPESKPIPAPEPSPAPAGNGGERLKFAELYKGASITEGLVLSDKVNGLNGRRVTMAGYMAPPLKASLDFFVLTKVPMAICPFCSTDADWPDDIILVLVDKPVEALPFTEPIEVTGPFEVGGMTDDLTGFYSLLRIRADSIKAVK